jgi:hypothetical protein
VYIAPRPNVHAHKAPISNVGPAARAGLNGRASVDSDPRRHLQAAREPGATGGWLVVQRAASTQVGYRVVRLGRGSLLGDQIVEQSREGGVMSSSCSMGHAVFAENSSEGILHEVSCFDSLHIALSEDQIVERR